MSRPATSPEPPSVAPPGGTLRIALTLPGGVSFGTVEAGAVCALVVAVQEMNRGRADSACIDIIAGSSAGALSGVLAAHTLLFGQDPVPVFRRAWVSEPSLSALLGRGRAAPLSLRRARAVAKDLLAGRMPADVATRQRRDVTLMATLGCLRGLGYEITGSGLEADKPRELRATSYLDWASHKLSQVPTGSEPSEAQTRAWKDAVDAAMASAAHPAGFAPARLQRNRKGYKDNHVTGLLDTDVDKGVRDPDEQIRLWYTDGGLVDNQPLGRCLKLVMESDNRAATESAKPDPDRRVLLVRSGVDRPPDPQDPAWAGATRPRWTETLQRALGLLAAHNIGEDLRQLEKVNTRLQRSVTLAERLVELVPKESQEEFATKLNEFLGEVDSQRSGFFRHRGKEFAFATNATDASSAPKAPFQEVVQAALLAASGLHGKRWVDVDIIEPHRDVIDVGGHGLLQFGGFLDRRRREYDFAAGYWAVVDWMQDSDSRLRASPDVVKAVKVPVRKPPRSGERAWRSRRLRPRNRLLLARLGLRVAKISVGDAIAIRRRKKVT